VSRRVQNAVDSELRCVAGLEGPDTVYEACAGASEGSGQVAAAGVEGEILAPGAALAAGLLDEEVFRRGGEVVEVSNWSIEILVGIVGSGSGLRIGVWLGIGHGKRGFCRR